MSGHFSKCALVVALVFFLSSFNAYSDGEVDLEQKDKTVDVSGKKGRDGQDGRSHNSQAGRGQYGRDGGNATEAERGQHAGEIAAFLKEKAQGVIEFSAEYVPAEGTAKRIRNVIRIGSRGFIRLLARGGDGGHGGNGGKGQRGGRGHDGTDATRYSNGTNGDNGKRGGDGGLATDGKRPGDGGRVFVNVPADQTKLLMLIRHNIKAGTPGKHGTHGEPGRGGQGGDGGSSYSWTEYEQKSRTGADGKTEYYTDTKFRSNPGGFDGSTGPSGDRPTVQLFNGEPGQDGEFRIRVHHADGTIKEYGKRFNLVLDSFQIVSDNKDKIIEPGELVHLKNITIRNPNPAGEMATPANTAIRIYITDSKYFISQGINLIIPKSLAPGESYTFSGEDLRLRIKDIKFELPQRRIVWKDTVSPKAEVKEVNRHFEDFNNPKEFKITFPIEIEGLNALRALAPGQASRFFFKITNRSTIQYGDQSEIQRAIEYEIKRRGGDLGGEQLSFFTKDGKPLNLNSGIFAAIAKLGPGQSTLIEGIVSLSKDAESYRSGSVGATLSLGRIDAPAKTKFIQQPIIDVRASQMYRKTPGSDFLLITNSKMSRENVQQWKAQIAHMGSKVDVWDLSFEATLDLMKKLSSGSTLLQDFRGKTIILPTNTFMSGEGDREARPLDQLRKAQFMKALTQAGIGVYFVGPQQEKDYIERMIFPTNQGKERIHAESVSDLMRAIKENHVASDAKEIKGQGVNQYYDHVRINHWTFRGKPKAAYYQGQVARIEGGLNRSLPDSRYVVVTNFSPELISKSFFGLIKHWSYGSIVVRRTTDKDAQSGVFLNVTEAELLRADFASSPENLRALLMATPTPLKIEILQRLLSKNSHTPQEVEVLRAFRHALIWDIAFEQSLLRTRFWNAFMSKATMLKSMSTLRALSEMSVEVYGRGPSKEGLDFLMRLTTEVRYMLSAHRSFWDYILPIFRRDSKVHRVSRGLLNQMVERAVPFTEVVTKDVFWQSVRENEKKLITDLKQRRDKAEGELPRRGEQVREELKGRVKQTTSGKEVLADPEERRRTKAEIERARQDARNRDAKASKADRRAKDLRTDWIVPNPQYNEKANPVIRCMRSIPSL